MIVVALVAAVITFWVTLDARFLAHPGWLAVQKLDFILGPIGVGLYWRARRPANPIGVWLIVLGLLGIAYIGSSIDSPGLFSIGLFWEFPIVILTEAVILAFPSGRLDGLAERAILAFWVLLFFVPRTIIWLFSPKASPWFSISACRGACPHNVVAIWSTPRWAPDLVHGVRIAVIVGALATIALLVWKFVTGTPPRRRALAVGAPIVLIYLGLQTTYQAIQLFRPANASAAAAPVPGWIDWAFAGARSAVWYGFLLALIAAELFAGRVLRDIVRRSRGRPSARELEGMLRAPLGDPGLRVGIWDPSSAEWSGADGRVLGAAGAGQALTTVARADGPAVALIHDSQLSEDPELLQAAGDVLMLAVENAELDASWKESLRENNELVEELRASRSRIVGTAERERVRLERDLHDGAQQRLTAVQVKLKMAEEDAPPGPLSEQLEEIRLNAVEASEELRALAHGIYPSILRSRGLAEGLRSVARSSPIPVEVTDEGIGRAPEAVEAAIYFCAREAIQNAAKHAGPGARVTVILAHREGALDFAVVDDGAGMNFDGVADGFGLTGMVDRIEAAGGALEIVSAPGQGTTVHGRVPDTRRVGAGT